MELPVVRTSSTNTDEQWRSTNHGCLLRHERFCVGARLSTPEPDLGCLRATKHTPGLSVGICSGGIANLKHKSVNAKVRNLESKENKMCDEEHGELSNCSIVMRQVSMLVYL
jgi:hypothetical protein